MLQALRLAARGAGYVAPNPLVGAVIVKAGRVIGTGFHRRFGQAHAEINALSDCQERQNDPSGATMFVTLEPCCHHGKTPPCTEALAAAGITKVEIATLDQCELVAGKGAAWLRDHGIEVTVGCCERQACRLNAGFFKFTTSHRPQVILKWAQSIDGKLAWPPAAQQRWITGPTARRHAHRLRSTCGAVLVGIETVLADDPQLNVRLRRKMPQPLRVVLDSHLRIPIESKLVQTATEQPVLICCLAGTARGAQKKVETLFNLGCTITELPASDGRLDLHVLLHALADRGVTDLLVEGGPTVLHSFWSQQLADRLTVYIAPLIVGSDSPSVSITWTDMRAQLQDVTTTRLAHDVLIDGYLTDP